MVTQQIGKFNIENDIVDPQIGQFDLKAKIDDH